MCNRVNQNNQKKVANNLVMSNIFCTHTPPDDPARPHSSDKKGQTTHEARAEIKLVLALPCKKEFFYEVKKAQRR